MPERRYTDEQRTAALAIYEAKGPAEASRQTGIARGTISQWARRAAVTVTRTEQTRAATETARLTRVQRVAQLAADLLRDAERLRVQIWHPSEYLHWDKDMLIREHLEQPTYGEQKEILLATAIAIDKSQLLAGAATSRVETVEPEQVATIDKIIQLRQGAA